MPIPESRAEVSVGSLGPNVKKETSVRQEKVGTYPDEVQEAVEGASAAGDGAEGCPAGGLPGQQLHQAAHRCRHPGRVETHRIHQGSRCLPGCQSCPQHSGQVLAGSPAETGLIYSMLHGQILTLKARIESSMPFAALRSMQ